MSRSSLAAENRVPEPIQEMRDEIFACMFSRDHPFVNTKAAINLEERVLPRKDRIVSTRGPRFSRGMPLAAKERD